MAERALKQTAGSARGLVLGRGWPSTSARRVGVEYQRRSRSHAGARRPYTSSATSGSDWRTRCAGASERNSLEIVREPGLQRARAVGREADDLLLAEGLAQVLEGRLVADPRAEQPRAMVGEDRLSAVAAPAVGGLAHVLKHGEQLHALARDPWRRSRRGSGSGAMFAASSSASNSDGSIGRPLCAEQREGAGGDVGHERCEQALQAALVIRR